MSYDKEYYEERKKDVIFSINKATNRLIKSVYDFVQEREELIAKFRDISEKEKNSSAKKGQNK